jgi:hypothetical protein
MFTSINYYVTSAQQDAKSKDLSEIDRLELEHELILLLINKTSESYLGSILAIEKSMRTIKETQVALNDAMLKTTETYSNDQKMLLKKSHESDKSQMETATVIYKVLLEMKKDLLSIKEKLERIETQQQ